MFNVRVYLTNAVLACFDLAVTAACYFAVYGAFDTFMILVFTSWLAFSFYFGMYRSRRLDSLHADLLIILKIGLALWIFTQLLDRAFPMLALDRFPASRFVAVNFLALTLVRYILRACLREIRRRGHNVKRLVLIASEELAGRIEQKIIRRSHFGYRLVKRFIVGGDADFAGNTLPGQLRQFLQSNVVDDVILALPVRANELCIRLVAECENRGINVRIVPDLFPLIQTDTQIYDLDGIPIVNARLYPAEFVGYVVFKRVFDFTVSFLVLILLSPVFLAVSVLIKATSPGPVFFTQNRVGMNGKRFRIIKFRTMSAGPSLDPDSHWTVRNDRHITRIGRWLRQTNLDELPQFANVLKGEMSLVGPRPERPFFLERFRREVPEYMARHYVKSGITGWAQVNGWRGDTPIPQRVEHDLYYIRNWTVSLDIKILFLTLARLFVPGAGSLQQEETRES